MRKIFALAALAGSLMLTPTVQAAWVVDGEQSTVTFLSVKALKPGNEAATEVLRFNGVQGTVDKSGQVQASIALAGLDTGIPVRDERMRTMLFQEQQYPAIEFKGQAGLEGVQDLQAGQSALVNLDGELSIAGQTKPFKSQLRYIQLKDGRAVLTTQEPIVLNALDFKLGDGIEALRKVAGLTMISTTVPVNLSITVQAQQ
ncbi:YceI family protein [Alcaligenes sp. SDU_A2]|uniref:YceI family protein n=1 Tax=Alcaligenes sp. SDU_A2 TaxID=3136634 RepID=UPI002D16AC80|nr:YceI family protein [Alcaligenes sp.]HRL27500.1 YceI family protein [Alcaligenes sp.]